MSSTPSPTQMVEALDLPVGKALHTTLVIEYRPMTETPEPEELAVLVDLLNAVYKYSRFGELEV